MKKFALLLAVMMVMLCVTPVMRTTAEDASLTLVSRATHTIRDSGVKITLPSGSFVVSFSKLSYQSTSAWQTALRQDGLTVGTKTSDDGIYVIYGYMYVSGGNGVFTGVFNKNNASYAINCSSCNNIVI